MSDESLSPDQWLLSVSFDLYALLDKTHWWQWELRSRIKELQDQLPERAREVALMREMIFKYPNDVPMGERLKWAKHARSDPWWGNMEL